MGRRLIRLERESRSILGSIRWTGVASYNHRDGTELGFELTVGAADPANPIAAMLLTPTTPPPGSLPAPPESWDQLDTRLGELAPEVGLTVAEVDYPALADVWLAADEAGRRDLLDGTVDPRDLEEPRWQTAWQASPNDVCRAFAGLQTLAEDPALAPLDQILGTEDGGLGLDDDRWETAWFKGGSQAGVLTLSYLATEVDGRTFVVSLALADPDDPIDPEAQVELVSLARGAFALAADG